MANSFSGSGRASSGSQTGDSVDLLYHDLRMEKAEKAAKKNGGLEGRRLQKR
jgi:hypothetical protein